MARSPSACSSVHASMARKSLRSSSNNPCSSATRKTTCSTSLCTWFKSSRRASSSGPISLIVVCTGKPCLPKISQKMTGLAAGLKLLMPQTVSRSCSLGEGVAGAARPDKSPLTSARNTGTPCALNCSAMTCRVTVLPVPVAPAMRPCRFASAGSSSALAPVLFVPMWILSAMVSSRSRYYSRNRAAGVRPPRHPVLVPARRYAIIQVNEKDRPVAPGPALLR